ncbi:MAG: ATP-dependent protease subunit HslV [Armatimonadetes bacterium]|nr:ATP-dependent protease subunit HslV [Armatimonadota bacterium]
MGAPAFRGTTVIAVRRGGRVAVGSDGQITFGEHAIKHTSRKVLRIHEGRVLAGFAGGAADALALLDKVENHVREARGDLERAAMGFAREWRTDRVLRQLQAMILVADAQQTFVFGGTGEVLRPDEDVVAIGSGGPVAHAAGLALLRHTDLGAEEIVREALEIAGRLCIYTNNHITVETLE